MEKPSNKKRKKKRIQLDRNEWNTNLTEAFIYGLMGYFYMFYSLYFKQYGRCGKGIK